MALLQKQGADCLDISAHRDDQFLDSGELLHAADAGDEVDRDVLAAFAAALGSMIERKVLVDRLTAQRDHVRSMLQATDDFVSAFCEAEIGLDAPRLPRAPVPGARRAVPPVIGAPGSPAERLLSRREMEVLRLMAGGATNARAATTRRSGRCANSYPRPERGSSDPHSVVRQRVATLARRF